MTPLTARSWHKAGPDFAAMHSGPAGLPSTLVRYRATGAISKVITNRPRLNNTLKIDDDDDDDS
jgi:hypothetical protein